MILLTYRFQVGGALRLGVKTPRGVVDVTRAAAALAVDGVATTAMEVIRGGKEALIRLQELAERADAALAAGGEAPPWLVDEADVIFGPPVPEPQKILCVGLNYRQHAEGSKLEVPKTPILFGKFNNALAAHGDRIPLPPDGEQFDYEAELCVVIGRRAQDVPVDRALDYVFGYCNANDFSCRDLQFRTGQWLIGKSFDGWCPIGPYLVTADAVPDPQRLRIRSYLNGERRQDATTADMIFPCAELIAYASRYMTLEPGDLILTGTPAGVLLERDDGQWLKTGDEIAVEIDGLGVLRNVVGSRVRAR